MEEALGYATKPEILDDYATHHSTKQNLFERLPPILILSLKRFVYDEVKGTLKVSKHISYPAKLLVPSELMSDSSNHTFQLYAGL